MRKLTASLAAALVASAIGGSALAQSRSYSVYVAPATSWAPASPSTVTEQVYVYEPYVYERRYVVPAPREYVYDPYLPPRRVYMEDAGRRWDAMVGARRDLSPYEADMIYGRPNPAVYPYASPYYSWPAGSLTASRDSNPNDHATGIYNPKP